MYNFDQKMTNLIYIFALLWSAFALGNSTLVVNLAPQWKGPKIHGGAAEEDRSFHLNLAPAASDPEGDPLKFKLARGASWITVSEKGVMSGIPRRKDVGVNIFKVTVTDGYVGHESEIEVEVTVSPTNHAPQWRVQTTTLDPGTERQPYASDLSKWAYDPDGDLPLTFSKISGPEWIEVSTSGKVNGIPQRENLGNNHLEVAVTDPSGLQARSAFSLVVKKQYRAPQWTSQLIDLSELLEDAPFSMDISHFAKSPDDDPIAFRKVEGPEWLQVDNKGRISGIPKFQNVGEFSLKVEAHNEGLGTATRLIGRVKAHNHPPELRKGKQLTFSVKEREILQIGLLADAYLEDKDGDAFTLSLETKSDWVSLSPKGEFVAKPGHAELGRHHLNLKANDGKTDTTFELQVTVLRNPRKPEWVKEIPALETRAREPFIYSLKGLAHDADNAPISFRLKEGPPWLKVEEDTLIATAPDESCGKNTFTVMALNDGESSEAVFKINVLFKNHPPVIPKEKMSFVTKERAKFEQRIHGVPYVIDSDRSDKLVFEFIPPVPTWIELRSDGAILATPGFTEIGLHTFNFSITDGTDRVLGTFELRVDRDPRPPRWLERKLSLTAKSRAPFTFDLSEKVEELDPVQVHFSKLTGPPWMQVTVDDKLSANPQDSDLGKFPFSLVARNDKLSTPIEGTIHVVYQPRPPYWTVQHVQLPEIRAGEILKYSVASFAKDPDPPHELIFKKISGPAWLAIKPDGQLTAVPSKQEQGDAQFVTRAVNNEGLFADVFLEAKVIHVNHPPTGHSPPSHLPDAAPNEPFHFEFFPFFSDPDGDVLTYRKVSGPEWIDITKNGIIQGTPRELEATQYTLVIEVSDGLESIDITIKGKVHVLPF